MWIFCHSYELAIARNNKVLEPGLYIINPAAKLL